MLTATLWDDDRLQERHREITGDRMRRNGVEWRGWCVLHEVPTHGSPSADYRVTPDGNLLAQCRSRACDGGEMVRALAGTTSVTYTTARPTVDEPVHDSPWNPSAVRAWLHDCTATLLDRPAPRIAEVRAYLKSRGITRAEVERFGLGVHVPGVTMDPPEPLDGDRRRNLSSLAWRVIFSTGSTSVEGRLVPSLADVTYAPDRKYDSRGAKRWWGIADVTTDEVALVEGVYDRVALERAEVPAVAVRGQAARREDVEALRHRGVTRAYLALDATADPTNLATIAETLARAGIEPVPIVGHWPEWHPGDDLGDLLALGLEELYEAVYGLGGYRDRGVLCSARRAAA